MSVFRIIFLGTPDFAASPLEKLLADEHFKVALVVTQPDRPAGRHLKLQPSPVKELALKHRVPVIAPENVNAPDVIEQLRLVEADAAVVVAFGQILRAEFLALFPRKAVNVHGSLLPKWRGAAPIQRSLMAGDQETGVALQVIVPKLDAGAVLGIRKVLLTDEDTAETLYARLKDLSFDLLSLDLVDYLRGNLTPQPQDESIVTIAKKIKKEEGLIDWRKSSVEIFNTYRGLYSWPGVWTLRATQNSGTQILPQQLKLWHIRTDPLTHQKAPGTVLRVEKDNFIVACGAGAVRVREVQPESRKRQSVEEYLKGYPLYVGDVFGA